MEPKVGVNSSLCVWNWNLMREAHDPVLILPKLRLIWQKFFPFFFSLKQILEGGGRNWWFQRIVLPEVWKPLISTIKCHFIKTKTLRTNPALSTLIWEKRTHFALTSSVCLEKIAVTESVKVSVYRKNRKMEQTYRNTLEWQTTKLNRAPLCYQRCFSLPHTSLRPDVSNRQGTSVMMWAHASFLKPAPSQPVCALNKRRQKLRWDTGHVFTSANFRLTVIKL